MSITRNPIDQGFILKTGGLDAAGVCLEACRRWVNAILLKQFTVGNTVYDIMEPNGINELLQAHKKRNTKQDKEINNLKVISHYRQVAPARISSGNWGIVFSLSSLSLR